MVQKKKLLSKRSLGVGEKAQQLRTLAAFHREDLGPVATTHMAARNCQ